MEQFRGDFDHLLAWRAMFVRPAASLATGVLKITFVLLHVRKAGELEILVTFACLFDS